MRNQFSISCRIELKSPEKDTTARKRFSISCLSESDTKSNGLDSAMDFVFTLDSPVKTGLLRGLWMFKKLFLKFLKKVVDMYLGK